MGQNDPFKWSLRFPPNLVCLHLRYVPPPTWAAAAIGNHRSPWTRPGIRLESKIPRQDHRERGWSMKPFFGGSTGGTVTNIIQCICIYSSYFTLAWNNIFIHLGSPKIPMMHLHLQTNQRKNSHLSFSVQKHICPKKTILKSGKPVSFSTPFDGFVVASHAKTPCGVTKKNWSCL